MIKGLIFDLDGVIAETVKLHYDSWKEEVKKIGIDYSEKENIKLKGIPRLETLKAILKIYSVNHFSHDEITKISNDKNETYLRKIETSISPKDILPGIEQLIKDAKARNLKLSIASSSSNAPLILKKLGLIHYFDYIVEPWSIKNGKPAPDIYLKAAEGINLKPEECLGFEDAIVGIDGLNAAKIPAIAITHGDNEDWDKAQYVVEKTHELNLSHILDFFNN